MRRQIGIAAALTLATVIAGAPAQPRASLIHTVAWTVPTVPTVNASADAAAAPADAILSVALTNDGSVRNQVFVATDISGGVTQVPTAIFAPSGLAEVGAPAARGTIVDNRGCGTIDCAAVEPMPFAVGTAAFQVESFIGNAVTAARFISDSRGGTDFASGAYTTLGMVGIGNFALVAAGLIGLALTRRRDYIPPG